MRSIAVALLAAGALAGQASDLEYIYKDRFADRLVPLLCEAIRFPTEAGNRDAFGRQSKWLERQAYELGLQYRDAGPVTEIELAGPLGTPVLGLVVHGDVQPPGDAGWTHSPFECTVKDGYVYGRGSADDKGPLVQALLSLATMKSLGRPRTHTVRILVGSDEESNNKDLASYLQSHKAPDLTLVLDSEFPVVVGEKAWDALELTAAQPYQLKGASGASWSLLEVRAGIAASIVPPLATARLSWLLPDRAGFESALNAVCPKSLPDGYRCEAQSKAEEAVMTVFGRAAHSGMNIQGGRNALVLLSNALDGKVAPSPAADLLDFAVMAGRDLTGAGLGLAQRDPLWGQYSVNVAKIEPAGDGKLKLTINLRRIPPLTGEQIKQHLARIVSDFNRRQESTLEFGGDFQDEPFAVAPDAKLVRRLLAVYERATGEKARPAIAGGATYAKRLPNAVAFGMWFPGQPYPGHDVNERIPIKDLHRGVAVLLAALDHLAFGEPLRDPLQP